jgi:hypothetical protein
MPLRIPSATRSRRRFEVWSRGGIIKLSKFQKSGYLISDAGITEPPYRHGSAAIRASDHLPTERELLHDQVKDIRHV